MCWTSRENVGLHATGPRPCACSSSDFRANTDSSRYQLPLGAETAAGRPETRGRIRHHISRNFLCEQLDAASVAALSSYSAPGSSHLSSNASETTRGPFIRAPTKLAFAARWLHLAVTRRSCRSYKHTAANYRADRHHRADCHWGNSHSANWSRAGTEWT